MDRLPPHIINILKDARRSATLENASLGSMPHDVPVLLLVGEQQIPKPFENITELVKEYTRLHHGSWIIGAIDRVLKWSSEPKCDEHSDEYDVVYRLRQPLVHPEWIEEALTELEQLREEIADLKRFKASVKKAMEE